MEPGPDPGPGRRASGVGDPQAGRRAGPLTTLTELAPAKVNLFLHVGPPAADGYHPLCSLVAFADVGDRVTLRPAPGLSLQIVGPFSEGLRGSDTNLVVTALRALAAAVGLDELPVSVTLDKRLPIAAGLGGGSSDAGAAMRLADRALGLGLGRDRLADIARGIGADGPMCLMGRTAWAEGIGERLTPEDALPPLAAVLVNPGRPSPTGAVYRAYDARVTGTADRPPRPIAWSLGEVVDWLGRQRNDLQAPAVALEPAIGAALDAVAAQPGVGLARMSGSGATVFGLFQTQAAARAAADRLQADHPDWWVMATLLGGQAQQ